MPVLTAAMLRAACKALGLDNQEAPKCENFKRTARVSEKNKRA